MIPDFVDKKTKLPIVKWSELIQVISLLCAQYFLKTDGRNHTNQVPTNSNSDSKTEEFKEQTKRLNLHQSAQKQLKEIKLSRLIWKFVT